MINVQARFGHSKVPSQVAFLLLVELFKYWLTIEAILVVKLTDLMPIDCY